MQGPFGKHLDALMRSRDWDQNDLAAKLGVPSGSVSRFVTGTRKPRMEHVPEWCRRLDLSPTEAVAFERAAALERASDALRQMMAESEAARQRAELDLASLRAEVKALKDVIAQSMQGR